MSKAKQTCSSATTPADSQHVAHLLHQAAVRLLDLLLAGIAAHTQRGPGVVQRSRDLPWGGRRW